jgi:hypothetical protein
VRWGAPGLPPKNGKERDVVLIGPALDAMKQWLSFLPELAKKNPLGLVFPTARGKRRRMKKPIRKWAEYLKLAKMQDASARHDRKSFRWHDLRHTCATSLVNGWWGRTWSLPETRDVMGHSSIDQTEKYAHVVSDTLAAAASATLAPMFNLPKTYPDSLPEISENAAITAARHRGFEPLAFGSGGRHDIRETASDSVFLGGFRASLIQARDRFRKSVAGRSRFSIRHGEELATLVDELIAKHDAFVAAQSEPANDREVAS